MSELLFQDVLNACFDGLASTVGGDKTITYNILVGNSSSNDTLLQLITTLDLSSSFGTKRSFSFFVENVLPKMANFASLDLSNNQIGNNGAQSIAKSKSLTNLNTLNLSENRIGDDGARFLGASTCLSNLTKLDLGDNQ